MTEEFNNQHHQHQDKYRGWSAWLNSNPLPSYLIESSGIVAILKFWKLLILLEFWMGSKTLLFAYEV